MQTVETVLGAVDAGSLGVILSHEHVLISMGEDNQHYPWLVDWERTRANTVRELSEARDGGIGTIIDLTTPDLGRDIAFVRDVASEVGINVVVATGIWRDIPRSFWERDPDRIADIFCREIEVGIGDTSVKAGVIKVANDIDGVTPHGERILRGAARAAKRTGCPISTHHWAPGEVGRRQVEVFLDEGAPMNRICIGHSADTTDADYLESLLRTGVYLSMDRYPGAPPRPTWEERNATVRTLIDRGWVERLMLGHDHAPSAVSVHQRPSDAAPERTRYLFLSDVALPALRASGVAQDDIDTMMRVVPARFVTGA